MLVFRVQALVKGFGVHEDFSNLGVDGLLLLRPRG